MDTYEEDFPRWKDPTCPHAPVRQVLDGHGVVCRDCGRIRVFA